MNNWDNENNNYKKDKHFTKKTILDTIPDGTQITKVVIPDLEITYRETGFGVYSCLDAHASQDDVEERYSIKGTFVSPLSLGQTYEVKGTVITYKSSYGEEKQINVVSTKSIKPVNAKGIISYMQTLKGLKTRAELIYSIFGNESLDVLLYDPLQVSKKIKGIGKKKVLAWSQELERMKDSQETISTLLGYGLTPKQAKQLYIKYKDMIISIIESNPYFLAKEVRGFGFKSCDKIARTMGYDPKGPFRLQEGIIHVLSESSTEGHCYLPKEVLVKEAIELLRYRLSHQEMATFLSEKIGQPEFEYKIGELTYMINYNMLRKQYDLFMAERHPKKKELLKYTVVDFEEVEISEQFEEMNLQDRIILEREEAIEEKEGKKKRVIKEYIYLKNIYYAELKVAERVIDIAQDKPFKTRLNFDKELDRYLSAKHISLEEKQRLAVKEFGAFEGGFNIVNGSAGCGKTFTLKVILAMLEMQYNSSGKKFTVKIFAPTGKASKVAAKATGLKCCTVHRGLGYSSEGGYEYDAENPLDCSVLVIDESSMLDILLTKDLLNAVKNGTKVIFLGDIKQLPSVGPGNVLKDLIESNIVKIVTLDVVKRQGVQSGVNRNANKIVNDEMIADCKDTKDSFVIYKDLPVAVQQTIITSFRNLIKNRGYTLDDIQLLCPQKTSLIGTHMMNYILQQEFNPNNNELVVKNMKFDVSSAPNKPKETITLNFKKGDKVIHIKNNYKMLWHNKNILGNYTKIENLVGITNGECGIIEDIIKVKESSDKEEKIRIIVRYEDKYVFYDDGFDELDHSWALTIHKSQGSQWPCVIIPIMKQNFLMLDNNLFYTACTRASEFNVVIGQQKAIEYAIKNHKIRDRYTRLNHRINKLSMAA